MSASDKSTLTSLSNTSQNTVDDVSKIKYNVNSTSLINVNAFCGVSMPYLSLTGILSDLESKCYDYNLTINNPG
jgi:ABC-type arginine/histidine transport system permease subunit